MKNAFQFVGVAILVILGIIIVKTLTLNSKQVPSENFKSIDLPDDIFQNLSKALRYKTISYNEESIPDEEAFIGFHDFLKQTFNIKSLPSNQKRNVIMVVEHTVTKNKYFFHEEGVTDEVKLISLLFD